MNNSERAMRAECEEKFRALVKKEELVKMEDRLTRNLGTIHDGMKVINQNIKSLGDRQYSTETRVYNLEERMRDIPISSIPESNPYRVDLPAPSPPKKLKMKPISSKMNSDAGATGFGISITKKGIVIFGGGALLTMLITILVYIIPKILELI